jgi:hypothetical protein
MAERVGGIEVEIDRVIESNGVIHLGCRVVKERAKEER